MKTFFSIIYLPLNPNLQEKISVGLVMSNGNQSIFKVSNPKMQIIKGLISLNNQLTNLPHPSSEWIE